MSHHRKSLDNSSRLDAVFLFYYLEHLIMLVSFQILWLLPEFSPGGRHIKLVEWEKGGNEGGGDLREKGDEASIFVSLITKPKVYILIGLYCNAFKGELLTS